MTVSAELRTKVADALKKKRDLTASTLRTYVSLLSNVLVKLGEDDPEYFETNVSQVMKHIDSLEKPQTRKTLLSALVVLTDNAEYRKSMLANVAEVTANYKQQKHDPERVAKLLSPGDIRKIHEGMMQEYQKSPTVNNTVNVLITGLMSGYYPDAPPRRIIDYSLMKHRNFDKKQDNYITGKEMVFHRYKTAAVDKAKGKDGIRLTVPPELRPILIKWKRLNGSDWLLINTLGEPFTSSSLNKRLTSIYGFGVDMLRSIFITELYKDVPKLTALENTAHEMGHSVQSASLFYAKKD